LKRALLSGNRKSAGVLDWWMAVVSLVVAILCKLFLLL